MVLDYYYSPASPFCHTPRVLAKALGLELNLKLTNSREGDTRTPEFLKLNPSHTLPTLVDNGHSVWESRAILQYLCDAYDKEGSFYPRDARQRSIINRLLYFDLGTLSKALIEIFGNIRAGKPDDTDARKRLIEALELLEGSLTGRKWLLGEQLTIADISLVVTVALGWELQPDFSAFPNIQKWMEAAKKEMPGYDEIVKTGMEQMKEHINQLKSGK